MEGDSLNYLFGERMSLLIYNHTAEEISIYTDTLATTPEGEPLAFCDKAFVVPHLNMVFATTGVLQLALLWHDCLNGPIFAQNIDDLDIHTPKALRKIWQSLNNHYGRPVPSTGTIYHFGWSDKHDRFVRYIYRSENNFDSELHTESGMGIKPRPIDENNFQLPSESVDDIVTAARILREQYLAQPKSRRIYIGGMLNAIFLSRLPDNYAPLISLVPIYKFEDYDKDQNAIENLGNLKRMHNFPQISEPLLD
jgi:hypothetical protein